MVATVRRAKCDLTKSLTAPFSLGSAEDGHSAFKVEGSF
jgi:hypothetical protein